MNQSSVFYDILNIDAVAFSEACLIVRSRIVEAADTMTNTYVKGAYPARLKAFWPDCADDYGKGKTRSYYQPDAKAISRAEEVFYNWFPLLDDDSRKILSKYAFRQAAPKKHGSIGNYCRKKRVSRSTFDRHVVKAIQSLAETLLKKGQLLQCPSWSRVMTIMPNSHIKIDMMATVTYWRASDARPSITLHQA